MDFVPGEERSTSILVDKIKDIDNFILVNKEKINETEKKNLESKKDFIQKRIEQILSSSQRAMEKLQKTKNMWRTGQVKKIKSTLPKFPKKLESCLWEELPLKR